MRPVTTAVILSLAATLAICAEKPGGGELQEWLAHMRAVKPQNQHQQQSSGGLATLLRIPTEDKAFQIVSLPLSIKSTNQQQPAPNLQPLQSLQNLQPPQSLQNLQPLQFLQSLQPIQSLQNLQPLQYSQPLQSPQTPSSFLGYGNPSIYYLPVNLASYNRQWAFPSVEPVLRSWTLGPNFAGAQGYPGGPYTGYSPSSCSQPASFRNPYSAIQPYHAFSPYAW